GLSSKLLERFGWVYSAKNTPAAYLIGYLAGKRAVAKGITEAVLDLGLARTFAGIKYYAVLKGAVDAGLAIPHDPSCYPSQERILGNHIVAHAKQNPSLFSGYKKKGVSPSSMESIFTKVKQALQ
ncbi:MAG: 50S ribosomal protein L18, partial [Candidatus Woesearchaeota archaeon]